MPFPALRVTLAEAFKTDPGVPGVFERVKRLVLGSGGVFKSADDGQRIEITNAATDRIKLFTGDDDEGIAGRLLSDVAGSGASRTLHTALWAPEWDDANTGGIYMVLTSESYDDTTAPPQAIFAYTGDSAQTPRILIQNGIELRLASGSVMTSQNLGTAAAPVVGIGSGEDTGIYEVVDGELGFTTNGTHRMSLDSSGLSGPAVEWTTHTPSYTNLTVGDGTVSSRYIQIGDTVIWRYKLTFGSTTTMGTNPILSVPVTMSGTYDINAAQGFGRCFESGGTNAVSQPRYNSSTTISPKVLSSSGSYVGHANITASVPFTWGTNDVLSFTVIYEAA